MSEHLEQYKAYLQDLGNLGSRHETARGFFLSVLSALIAFLALAGNQGPLGKIGGPLYTLVAIAGIAVCAFWIAYTLSLSAIYRVKFRLLGEIEKNCKLPCKLFSVEFPLLTDDPRYSRLTYIECGLAVVLAVLFFGSIVIKWKTGL